MREILFRGKRLDNGEWVEGCYITDEQDSTTAYIGHIFGVDGLMLVHDMDIVKVAPETVCQYTGLTDKNGRKIFDGDIIKYSKKFFKIVWVVECAHFAAYPLQENSWSPCMNVGTVKNVEVIGNIFDNPDLVEV